MRCDLEVEISPSDEPGRYRVSVDSPAGTAVGTIRLDAADLLGRRRELAASVLASAVTSRAALPSMEVPVREVGTALFRTLFAEHVYGRYAASLQEAARLGEPLRVVLRLRAPELAGLPWETMFDAEAQEYLCQREPVVRYVETAHAATPLEVDAPLRVLGMVAAPRDLPALDIDEERRHLTQALGDLVDQGLVELEWTESGTWPVLQRKLQEGPWHILHVVGHGGTSPSGSGLLALEDEQTGNASLVSASRFARLLHACRPVPRLVVLNSCSSGESAADDLLSSTAASLVHSGISAAVAMQFAVTDLAALAFARGFYQAIARNTPVDEAVRLGRISIVGTSEQTLEWVTPVLYLRTEDARLFTMSGAGSAGGGLPAAAGAGIAQEAAGYGLYVQALAAMRTERFEEAVTLLDTLLKLDPSYRDARQRKAAAEEALRLSSAYTRARAAEGRGDWDAARRGYDAVTQTDPGYRDAAARRESCAREAEVRSLQDELRLHAADARWDAVVAVSDQLAALDPAAADPEGLASEARAHAAADEEPDPGEPVERGALSGRGPSGAIGVAPAATAPTDSAPVTSSRPVRRASRRWALVAAAPVVVLGTVLGTAAVLGGGGGDPAGQHTDSPDPTPSQTSPSPTPPGQTPPATVTCWNGVAAESASACPLPKGRAGMAAVFPSLDDACGIAGTGVPGKVEVFECRYGRYMIRYSRWNRSTDRFAYYDHANPDAKRSFWSASGASAGVQWTSVERSPLESKPYQWSATYESLPYSVSVEAVSEADRSKGIARVKAVAPRDVGLKK